jgi:ribosomal protein S27AE
MSMNGRDYVSEYEACPECGMPSFLHDDKAKRHICVREECGYVENDEESIWTRLLRLLRLKRK